MEDLEVAVLACLDPTVDPALKQRALDYCQNIRTSPDGWPFLLQSLSLSMKPAVAFWCLTVIHDIISNPLRYPANLSAGQRMAIRSTLLTYMSHTIFPERFARSDPNVSIHPPNFLLNKVAQVIVSLIASDYPHSWPFAFHDCVLPLVGRRGKQKPSDSVPSNSTASIPQNANATSAESPFSSTEVTYGSVGMFLRLLRAIDDDVTSVRAAQVSDIHRTASVRVKDAMRDDCVIEIIQVCADLIHESKFACQGLDIIARYIEWIDVGLVVQERILKPIYQAISAVNSCAIRGAAAACLRAIILKRMAVGVKAQLLQMLDISTLLSAIRVDVILSIDEDNENSEVRLQSSRVEVASLINTIAIVALDFVKAFFAVTNPIEDSANTNGSTTANHNQTNTATKSTANPELFVYVSNVARHSLRLALQLLDENSEEGNSSSQTLECVTAYVSVYGQLVQSCRIAPNHENVAVVGAVLNFIEERGLCAEDVDPTDENSERGRAFSELRLALVRRVFYSIGRWFTELCVEFVRQLYGKAMKPVVGAKCDVSRVELALVLVVSLISVAGDNPKVLEISSFVLSNPPQCMRLPVCNVFQGTNGQVITASSEQEQRQLETTLTTARKHLFEVVSVNYFDVVGRSVKTLVTDSGGRMLSIVLGVLFDERGLGHLFSETVRSKAASALVKISKPLRGVMSLRHVEAVVQAANDHIFPVEEDVVSQRWKNQMLMFETVGYLLGTMQNRDASQVVQLVRVILKTIVEGVTSRQGIGCVAYIGAAGYLSKGFGGDSKYMKTVESSGSTNASEGVKCTNDWVNNEGQTNLNATKVVMVRNDLKRKAMSEEMKRTWVECLESVLKGSEPCLTEGGEPWMSEMRLKVIFFLHRMVETVGTSVIWYLERIVRELLRFGQSASEFKEVMSLLCQSTIKFRKDFGSVISKVDGEIVDRVRRVSFVLDERSGLAVSEADREMVEVVRVFMYWVNVMVGCEMMDAWWEEDGVSKDSACGPKLANRRAMLGVVVDWVVYNAIGEKMDIRVASSVMRMAWQTIGCMIERWAGDKQLFERGMNKLVMNQVAEGCVKCLLVATLFKNGEYYNGEAVHVVTEIVRVQSRCARRFGAHFADAVYSFIGHAVSQEDWNLYLTDLTKVPLTSTFQESVQRWIAMVTLVGQASSPLKMSNSGQ